MTGHWFCCEKQKRVDTSEESIKAAVWEAVESGDYDNMIEEFGHSKNCADYIVDTFFTDMTFGTDQLKDVYKEIQEEYVESVVREISGSKGHDIAIGYDGYIWRAD